MLNMAFDRELQTEAMITHKPARKAKIQHINKHCWLSSLGDFLGLQLVGTSGASQPL
jgi:hypothetical protein